MTRKPTPDMFADAQPATDAVVLAVGPIGHEPPRITLDATPYQLFDPLTEEEYAALKADIAERGVLVPVDIDENGMILDGHHRVRAWQELRSEGVMLPDYPRLVRAGMTEEQKRQHARVLNLVRRHLSNAQRAPHWLEMRKNGMTPEKIAEVTGVSNQTIRNHTDAEFKSLNSGLVNARGQARPTSYKPRQAPKASAFAPNGKADKRIGNAMKQMNLDAAPAEVMVERDTKRQVKNERDEAQRAEVLASVQTVDVPWLIVGDFRQVSAQIPSASVDLIFTDPPYDKAAADLYGDLAILAARVLKPGGILMAYSGQMHLPQIFASMGQHLEYMWTCAIGHADGDTWFRKWHLLNRWKPVLMYGKPPVKAHWAVSFADFVTGGKEKADHEWQQSLAEADHYIKAVCPAGGIVLDPFTGSGTTLLAAKRLGMQYIGIEKDPATAARARIRVEEVL